MAGNNRLYIGLVAASCMLSILGGGVFVLTSGSLLFTKVVGSRIPQSVHAIKTDRWRALGRQTYVLRFDITEEDLLTIARTGHFTKLGYIDVESYDGGICYGMTFSRGNVLILYGTSRRQPPWFDLDEWEDVVAYVVERELEESRYTVRLLLYSERRGAAYFIEDEVKGHWSGGRSSVTNRVSE